VAAKVDAEAVAEEARFHSNFAYTARVISSPDNVLFFSLIKIIILSSCFATACRHANRF
jgi:hypothetical protein